MTQNGNNENGSGYKILLDLSTMEPERGIIRVDGKDYWMMHIDDMGPKERAILKRFYRMGSALPDDATTDAEFAAEEKLLDECVMFVVPELPEEALHGLSYGKKTLILNAFTTAAPVTAKNPARVRRPVKPKTTLAR